MFLKGRDLSNTKSVPQTLYKCLLRLMEVVKCGGEDLNSGKR